MVAKKQCEQCQTDFTYPSVLIGGREAFVPRLCPACLEAFNSETERVASEQATLQLRLAWESICPPLYRDTDPMRLTEKIGAATFDRVNHWMPNRQGIGLTGTSGTGKTRMMFWLLRNLHFEGHRIAAITAKRFEHWCHRMFEKDDDARTQIKAARIAKILFIDDIGKEKYTERVESEFYDLIEHRTSHLLPILWTANATGEQLVRMMGEDRGAPIVRRLREFSMIISV